MRGTALAFNRVLALFLSFVLGFLSFAATLVGVSYVAYTQLSIDNLEKLGIQIDTENIFDPDAEVPVNSLTLQGLISEITALTQVADEVTLENLVERYGLTIVEKAVDYIPPKLWKAKFSDLFSERGGDVLLKSVDVDFVLQFVPEDVISEPLRETISGITLADVVELELGYIFDGVELGFLLGVEYVKNDNGEYVIDYADDENPTFIELLAPLNLGDVLTSVTEGEGNLFDVIKNDIGDVMVVGIIEAITQTEFAMAGLFGDKTIGDLISEDEDGNVVIDLLAILEGATLGSVMGYYYDEEADKWFIEEGGDEVDAMTSTVCGIIISDLIEPPVDEETGEQLTQFDIILDSFGTTSFGDLLGYVYDEAEDKWYVDDGTDPDERTEADAITGSICGITIGDLLDPEGDKTQMDVLMDALGGNTFGALMGYVSVDVVDGEGNVIDTTWHQKNENGEAGDEVDGITGSICGITIGDLLDPEGDKTQMDIIMDALGDNTLGSLMGYVAKEEDDGSGNLITKWYEEKEDGSLGAEADAMTSSLCGITLGDLLDPEGDETQMDILMDALGENKLGDLMDYVPKYQYDEDGNLISTTWHEKDENGDPADEVDSLTSSLCGITLGDLLAPEGDETQMDILMNALGENSFGEIMGYYKNGDTWYEDDTLQTEVEPLFAALCNIMLSDLMDPEEGKSASDAIMEAFKQEETTLGDIMGYYKDGDTWYVDDGTTGEDRTEADALFAALCGVKLHELMDPEEGKTASDAIMDAFKQEETTLGDIMGYYKNGDTWYEDDTLQTEVDALFAALCDVKLHTLMAPEEGKTASDAIMDAFAQAETTLGDIMGYYKDGDTWYVDDGTTGEDRTEADALFAALCGVKLHELMDPGENRTASDVVMDAFEAAETMLGDIMGYEKEINQEYDPDEAATNENYDVDKYIWYSVDEETGVRTDVSGIGAIVAGYSLVDIMENGLNTDEIMEDLTLAEVFNLEKLENLPVYVYIDDQLTLIQNPPTIDVWVDGEGVQASAIIGALAGYNVSELDSKIDTIKIGQVIGVVNYDGGYYTWSVEEDGSSKYIILTLDDSVTSEFADVSLEALSNGELETTIERIELGKFLGLTKREGVWYEYDEETDSYVEADGIMGIVAGATTSTIEQTIEETKIGDLAGFKGIQKKDEHGNPVYDENNELVYVWYEEYYGENHEDNVKASGILGGLADLSVSDLTDSDSTALTDAVQKLQVAEVLGYTLNSNGVWEDSEGVPLSGIMASIAGTEIGQLSSKIDDITIAEILGYKDNGDFWYIDNNDNNSFDENVDEKVTGILAVVAGSSSSSLKNDIEGASIGEIAGYVSIEETDENGDPITVWYEEYYGVGDSRNVKATGILGALSNVSVSDLTDSDSTALTDAVQKVQVAEVLGYTLNSKGVWEDSEGVPLSGIMASIAGTEIGQLSSKIDDITIAEILGYKDNGNFWYIDNNDNNSFDENVDEKVTGILAVVAGSSSSSLKNDIEGASIGEIAGYVSIEETDGNGDPITVWYEEYYGEGDSRNVKATGILGALSNVSVSDLTDSDSTALTDAIKNIEVADALGYEYDSVTKKWYSSKPYNSVNEVKGIMAQIAGTKIGSLNSDINSMTIGKMAGYYQKDGQTGEGKPWYTDENCTIPATGMLASLADLTIDKLTDSDELSNKISDINIGVVLGYEERADGWYDNNVKVTGVIGALAGSTIATINTDIEEKYMGDLLGYIKVEGVWYVKYVAEDSPQNEEVDSLMNAVANSKFSELDTLYSKLTVNDVIPNRTGFLQFIDGDATLDNMGSAVTNAFDNVTVQQLLDENIVQIDSGTQDTLDMLLPEDTDGDGLEDWRNQKLPDSFNYIINKLISKIPMLP